MKSFVIDTGALGAVMVREAPIREVVDPSTGEMAYYGRLLVPGERGAVDVRIKTRKRYNGGDFDAVTLIGDCKITAWYMKVRGAAADRAEVTISCDELRKSTDEPILSGRDVPVVAPRGVRFIGRAGDQANLGIPADLFDRDGGSVLCRTGTISDSLKVGDPCTLMQPAVRVVQPASEDIGRYGKAELVLSCAAVMPAVSAPAPKGGPKADDLAPSAA